MGCLDRKISFFAGENRVFSLYEHIEPVAIFSLRRVFLPIAVGIPSICNVEKESVHDLQ